MSEIYIITRTVIVEHGTQDFEIISAFTDFESAGRKFKKIAKDNNIECCVFPDKYTDWTDLNIGKRKGGWITDLWAIIKIPISENININTPISEPNMKIKEQLDRIEKLLKGEKNAT